MTILKPASRLKLLGALLAATCVCGCWGSTNPSERPLEELPTYEAEPAQWFDDSLSPSIFGLPEGPDVTRASYWEQLVQSADYVSRVRLTTVTRARTGDQVSYRVVLRPVGSAIRGPEMEDEIEVRVGLDSPSIGLLHSLDTEAVGKKFIVFLKRFRANDQSTWHFRGVPESAKTLEAIELVN